MGEAPGFGSGGAAAQPCRDSCCPAALQHPRSWGLEWPLLQALPHAAALPRGIGVSEPALESPGWPHSSGAAGAACASFTSVRWEHPTPPQPLCSDPIRASALEWLPANRGLGANRLWQGIVWARHRHLVKHFGYYLSPPYQGEDFSRPH